jgi:sensor c-di-GMP phosphodiesterase-like protein
VVQLAHRLGMIVVAEGVETAAAAQILAQLGCDRGQGYLYAKALPLEEFIAWQRARRSNSGQTRR